MNFGLKIWLKPAYLLAMALSFLTTNAFAHKPSDSYLTMRVQPGGSDVSVRWDIALRDLDYVLQLDRDNDGALTWGEVRQRSEDITRYATTHLTLSSKDKPCTWQTVAPMMLDKHSDGTYAVLSLTGACGAPLSDRLQVTYSLLFDVDPSHRGLVQWIPPGAPADPKTDASTALSVIFGTESASQSLAFKAPDAWETLRQYVADGVWHIWIGYDHILFLLALLLPAVFVRKEGKWQPADTFFGAFKEVLKVVTAFTLAHSITLSLAALGVISLPSRWVESAIAASVVVAAVNNLRGVIDSKRWVMAFGFGLIHGFGFASVLADLGLPPNALVLALVGFNVGVEVGQLTIVAIFLPLAFWLRATQFYRVSVFKWGSGIIALLALYWFAQRAFDL